MAVNSNDDEAEDIAEQREELKKAKAREFVGGDGKFGGGGGKVVGGGDEFGDGGEFGG